MLDHWMAHLRTRPAHRGVVYAAIAVLTLSSAAFCGPDAVSLRSTRPLAMPEVAPSDARVPRFGKFELTVRLSGTWDNPFNEEQIDVAAEFLAPSGTRVRLPAFFYQAYERRLVEDAEVLTRVGEPVWKVRYAAGEVGVHTYTVVAESGGRAVRSELGSFSCTPSDDEGFVRIARANPLYFEFDSGHCYFPIGENMCWPGPAGTYDYDEWCAKLHQAGGNYVRLWACAWTRLGLETAARDRPDWGLGKINLENAWRVDYVVELGRRLGIRQMFCLEAQNWFRRGRGWESNPYNAAVGGPCESPGSFLTDPTAKALFKRRLRYIVARWAYSPAIFSWQLWNEVSAMDDYDSRNAAAWHAEMSRYLRSIDPYDHLICTSYGNTDGDPAVDGLPEIDFVQTHSYGRTDLAGTVAEWAPKLTAAYGKPYFVGECGIGHSSRLHHERDPAATYLHNALWASIVSGAAGTAMTWWWDNFIDPQDLYHHFTPVARFTADVRFNRRPVRPANVLRLQYADPNVPPRYGDVALEGTTASWAEHPVNQPRTFTVNAEGKPDHPELLSRLAHGVGNHRDKHNPVTFVVTYPTSGRFVVTVSGVSGHGGAGLTIQLDDTVVLEKQFPDTAPDNTDTMYQYDGPYAIDVSAGQHRITTENTGADWFYAGYRFEKLVPLSGPNLRVVGLQWTDLILLWLQNRNHTWHRQWTAAGSEASAALNVEPGGKLTLSDVPTGRYRSTWYDTYSGETIGEAVERARNGKLTLITPPIEKDIAVKLLRQ